MARTTQRELERVSDAAFDAAASQYDDVAESALGLILRARVHDLVEGHLHPAVSMLDLGCGTGLDAAWAVARGANVIAVDASPQMVETARRRLGESARVAVLDLNDDQWFADLPKCDVITSNFGVVNCVSDLAGFGRQLGTVAAEGGTVVLVVMARVVPWELAHALVRFDRNGLMKRFRRRQHPVEEYRGLEVRYHSARALVRQLGGDWRITSAQALGWALPTFAQRGFADRHPRLTAALARVDRYGAGFAARLGLGDHQIVVLERE